MTLWKVVGLTLRSCVVKPEYGLQYVVGETTSAYPGSVGIFCYTRYERAIATKEFGYRILEVEGTDNGHRTMASIYNFNKQGFLAKLMEPVDSDVVLCDSVKVVREI